MAVACRCCAHVDRAALDEALISGMTLREVTRRWGVSKDSAWRHKAHISPALAKVIQERRSKDGPVSALSRLEDLYHRASKVLGAAEQEGNASLSLSAVRELRGLVETLAKITGELDESPKVQVLNVATSQEWVQLREVVLGALVGHPEAAADVVAALEAAGAGSGRPVAAGDVVSGRVVS